MNSLLQAIRDSLVIIGKLIAFGALILVVLGIVLAAICAGIGGKIWGVIFVCLIPVGALVAVVWVRNRLPRPDLSPLHKPIYGDSRPATAADLELAGHTLDAGGDRHDA